MGIGKKPNSIYNPDPATVEQAVDGLLTFFSKQSTEDLRRFQRLISRELKHRKPRKRGKK